MCEWLTEVGATVKRTCGFHVHVGFNRRATKKLNNLVHLVSQFEKALYASTGTHARETGHYCQSVRHSHSHVEHRYASTGRYHVLNLQSPHPTVEFRCFAGTTNLGKMVAHIRQCLGIVQKALEMKQLPKWTPKTPVPTSPLARKGEGLTALTGFFYRLGWTRGQSKVIYGNLIADECPTLEESKKELRRLAQKYDARTEEAN